MWKRIFDFPNYEISDLGEVRNRSSKKILKIQYEYKFPKVFLYKFRKPRLVNLDYLVARAFIKNPNSRRYKYILHFDGDLKNCNANNLFWIENNIYLTNKIQNIKCLETGETFKTVKEAAQKLKISESSVYKAIKEKNKFCGFSFILLEAPGDENKK